MQLSIIYLCKLNSSMKNPYLVFYFLILLQSCIGTDVIDDFVDARISIDNPISSLKADSNYQFRATYLNNVGAPETAPLQWKSSDEAVLRIDNSGLALALMEGESTVAVMANGVMDEMLIRVSDTTIVLQNERVAELMTVSSYPLSGNAILKKEGGKTLLQFDASFSTTSALPGLYAYLTNNATTINNALEVGKVTAFEGAQSYEILEEIELTTYDFVLFYCKPFLVPVGTGELKP
jgi:hypothetical protein